MMVMAPPAVMGSWGKAAELSLPRKMAEKFAKKIAIIGDIIAPLINKIFVAHMS